jgi:hypothetical protein
MHSYDHGAYKRIRLVTLQSSLYPLHLPGIELIWRGVIKGDEIYAVPHPVVIGFYEVIAGIVAQALRADFGRVKPIRELQQRLISGFGRNQFVISKRDENGYAPKPRQLILNEVLPGTREIGSDVHRGARTGRLMQSLIVLIKPVDRAEVAQVPVESCLIQSGSFSYGRHHDVSAVSRITGDGEMPRASLGSCLEGQGKAE